MKDALNVTYGATLVSSLDASEFGRNSRRYFGLYFGRVSPEGTGHCASTMSLQFCEIGAAVARLSGSQQSKWVLVSGSPQ